MKTVGSVNLQENHFGAISLDLRCRPFFFKFSLLTTNFVIQRILSFFLNVNELDRTEITTKKL